MRYTPITTILDTNGDPIVGAKTYFYAVGTTMLKTIYGDSGLVNPHENPVLSLAGGVVPEVFLDGLYKVVQKDQNDEQIGVPREPVGEIRAGQFDLWLQDKTYTLSDIVKGSDGKNYISLIADNQGNDPISNPNEWLLYDVVTKTGVERLTNKTYVNAEFEGPQTGLEGPLKGNADTATNAVDSQFANAWDGDRLVELQGDVVGTSTGSDGNHVFNVTIPDDSVILNKLKKASAGSTDIVLSAVTTEFLPAGLIMLGRLISSSQLSSGERVKVEAWNGASFVEIFTLAPANPNIPTDSVSFIYSNGANVRMNKVNATGTDTLTFDIVFI